MYEIKKHSRYVVIWKGTTRIVKIPISNDHYGLPLKEAQEMAERVLVGLKLLDSIDNGEIIACNCTKETVQNNKTL